MSQQTKRIIIEERGFPWLKWRKVKEWVVEECEHEWIYSPEKQGKPLNRTCEFCKRVEEKYGTSGIRINYIGEPYSYTLWRRIK